MAHPSVMVIDDEESILFILEDFISGMNLQPFMCKNLKQAIEILKNHSIHLILCDITLPDGNGMDFYQRIIRDYPHLKNRFILMTGFNPDNSLETFLKEKQIPFIQKPFQLNTIRSKIWSIINKL